MRCCEESPQKYIFTVKVQNFRSLVVSMESDFPQTNFYPQLKPEKSFKW